MSIKFRHKDGGTLYTITGSTLYWERNGVTNYSGGYTPEQISRYFTDGTWVKEPSPSIEAENGTWKIHLRDNDGEFYAAGFGVGVDEKIEKGIAATSTEAVDDAVKPIASDGGSSTYYDIGLPQWLVDNIVERQKEGRAYVKTEELIEVAFANDFDASNIFKSLVRAWGAFNGGGKKGNTVDYDLNKMNYSTEKLRQRAVRKQGATQ